MSRPVIKQSIFALVLSIASLRAQNIITTVAGTDVSFQGDGRPATQAALGIMFFPFVAKDGSVYAGDLENQLVVRVDARGILHVVAGNGIAGRSPDGIPATGASLNNPVGIAQGPDGSIYIADRLNWKIRRINPDGTLSTITGGGFAGFSQDNIPASTALVGTLEDVVVAPDGTLYYSDSKNHVVRKISPSQVLTTAAGVGKAVFSGDGGPGNQAGLSQPSGLALDGNGNLYIADVGNGRVRRVTTDGKISTVAGGGRTGGVVDGSAAVGSNLGCPTGVTVDPANNFYVADPCQNMIFRVDTAGKITRFAGSGGPGFSGDGGPALRAAFRPWGLASDQAGNIIVADYQNRRLLKVDTGGTLTTLAGNGQFRVFPEGTQATSALLFNPKGVSFDAAGNMYIADTLNSKVRVVHADGTTNTFAGDGISRYQGDGGSALNASLDAPFRVDFDPSGNAFIADASNNRVRQVTPDGIITTFAGGGQSKADGVAATSAILHTPSRALPDGKGSVYISDLENFVVRRVGPDGSIVTVAGNGNGVFSGDGGPATRAGLSYPTSIAFDSSGNLLIADALANRIRRVANGVIQTIAGNGTASSTGDGGPATSATLNLPVGMTADSAGNIYIVEKAGNRIRKINAAGIISTVAGNGSPAFSGDGGLATSASLFKPDQVTLDAAGNLYIADEFNNRIRKVYAASGTFSATLGSPKGAITSGAAATTYQSLVLSSTLPGLQFSVTTKTSDGGDWLQVSATSGSMPSTLDIIIDPSNLPPGSYTATLTVTAPGATPPVQTVTVQISVGAALPPALKLDLASKTVSTMQGGSPVTTTIGLRNIGGSAVTFKVSAISAPVSWLSVTAPVTTVTPSNPVALTITATPGSLPPGTYTGTITASGTASSGASVTAQVNIALTVTNSPRVLLLSQTGLTFNATVGGGAPLAQTFGILNTGRGSMDWQLQTNTLSGGPWLAASATSGTVAIANSTVSFVDITADPSNLAVGDYFGRVKVTASADNSPQFVSVLLHITEAGANLAPEVRPSGLVFTAVQGGNAGSQIVTIANRSAAPIEFRSTGFTFDGRPWFQYIPASASVDPAQPFRVTVAPNLLGLLPGEYHGVITFLFPDGAQTVNILAVVASSGANGITSDVTSDSSGDRQASGCTPSKITITQTSSQNPLAAVVGQATSVEIQATDSCGNIVTDAGSRAGVSAYYTTDSNQGGKMTYTDNGHWVQTFKPQSISPSNGTISVTAFLARADSTVIPGHLSIPVSISSGSSAPLVASGAVLNAASFAANSPIAPGELVSVFGGSLATATGISGSVPLPTQVGDTQVFLGETPLPILYASATQLNVQVPYGLALNAQSQVFVQRGVTISVPEALTVAPAQPAIFTVSQSGQGQGVIVDSAANQIVDLNAPTAVGKTLVIYCTGLGETNPPAPSGGLVTVATPTVIPVTVSIGGVNAAILYAGLTPGFPGLYQVNATIPGGVQAGNNVPVTVSMAGQTSPVVTIVLH